MQQNVNDHDASTVNAHPFNFLCSPRRTSLEERLIYFIVMIGVKLLQTSDTLASIHSRWNTHLDLPPACHARWCFVATCDSHGPNTTAGCWVGSGGD